MICLQVESVVGQLAFGAVKITFGELRQLAPGTFVNSSNSVYDSRSISLPLNEILTRINPALLARRPAVQKIEVADDISGPFGGNGRGVIFTAQPLKAPASSAPPAPRAGCARAVNSACAGNQAGFAGQFCAARRATAAPRFLRRARHRRLLPRRCPKSEPIAFSPRRIRAPGCRLFPLPSPQNRRPTAITATAMATAIVMAMAMAARFCRHLNLPLRLFHHRRPQCPRWKRSQRFLSCSRSWPKTGRTKSSVKWFQAGLANAACLCRWRLVEPGLKRGRVTMTWKDLRKLINPNSPASPSDDLDLSLPLKVIAPAFLAAQKKLSGAFATQNCGVGGNPQPVFRFSPTRNRLCRPRRPHSGPTPCRRPKIRRWRVQSPPRRIRKIPMSQKVADTNLFSAIRGGPPSDDSNLFQRTPVPATDFLSRQMQPKDVVVQAHGVAGRGRRGGGPRRWLARGR